MKSQLISMLAGAVVLVAPLTSMPVRAELQTPTQLFPALSGVELTGEQETQIDEIADQTLSEVEDILTTEQRDQFNAALDQGEDVRSAIASINPSPEQRTQLRTVFQSARTQLADTITPEQREQILQNMGDSHMKKPNP